MKQTISNASQFRDAFRDAGRQDQFSYEALGLLFDYLEDVHPDYELDVIGLCCDYAELTPLEVLEGHGVDLNDEEKEDAIPVVMEYLENLTTVVGLTSAGLVVYASSF